MTWLDGRPLMRRLDEDPSAGGAQPHRRGAVPRLVRAVLPLRRASTATRISATTRCGRTAALNLLDFGVIRVFAPKFVRGVIELFEAVRDDDDKRALHAYQTWGFTDITREKLAVLNEWARFLYEPLMEDRPRLIEETNDTTYGRAVAERVHAGLKRTGGVRPPREFVLMDRGAIGLGGVFLRLRAELNWHRLFQELVADFDAAALGARQTAALAQAGVPR